MTGQSLGPGPGPVFVDYRNMLRNVQTSLIDFVDHQSLQLRTAVHQFPDIPAGVKSDNAVFFIAEPGQGGQDRRFRRPSVHIQEDIDVFQILAPLRDHFDVFYLKKASFGGG